MAWPPGEDRPKQQLRAPHTLRDCVTVTSVLRQLRDRQACGLREQWFSARGFEKMLPPEAFVYLLLDAFSRKVIGWAMEDHPRASLAWRRWRWR
jgi:hypothetical protein